MKVEVAVNFSGQDNDMKKNITRQCKLISLSSLSVQEVQPWQVKVLVRYEHGGNMQV